MTMHSTLSAERFDLMGKPHIGPLRYANAKTFDATFDRPCCCEICGRPATNAHHIVPKGMGGGSRTVTVNGRKLRSPCIAVCGMGNASGCHKDLHDGTASIRWRWDSDHDRDMYLSGGLDIEPHSPEFYRYGCYVMTYGDGCEEVYR